MLHRVGGCMFLAALLSSQFLFAAEPRGRQPRSSSGQAASRQRPRQEPPGGDWSEVQHHSGQRPPQSTATSPRVAPAESTPTAKSPAGGSTEQSAGTSKQLTNAQSAAAGAAVAKRNSPQFSGAEGAVAGADAVRHNYSDPNLYSNAWFGAHPSMWAPTAYVSGSAWTASSWPTVAGFYGAAAAPISYGYGSNVVAQQGNVMVNGQNVGTTAQFSQQAAELAQAGADTDADAAGDWLPLGVFAMVRHELDKPNLILQMAIDKQGVLRGNYTDQATQKTSPIHGSVDSKTQRAAWMVGNNATTVMEAGLSNMASGEAPALIHKGGKTDHWLLVRLEQPPAK
jgi:hypothetical protein